MNWREKIVVDWPNDLQRAYRCRSLLGDLDRVLSELAGLGHPLHVEEGYEPPPPRGWPRAMFHIYQGARVVNCQEDLDDLGDDWYPTMDEARHAAGVTKQMQRGGIFTKSLPQALNQGQTPQEIQAGIDAKVAEQVAKREYVNNLRVRNHDAFNAAPAINGADKLVKTAQEMVNALIDHKFERNPVFDDIKVKQEE